MFVLTFLALFVVCGLFGIEAWPLTGFELFSHPRHDRIPGWEARAVDGSGAEQLIDFTALGRAYRGGLAVMRGFPRLSYEQRLEACRAWLAAARRGQGSGVVAVRVYHTLWRLPSGARGQAKPTLVTECR